VDDAPVQVAARPVLVELFTSEGCSSCPPADRFLIDLQQLQPVAGATIIALGQHVDYWNRLGWADPFSSAEFSARQESYAAVFGRDGVYTPQMVVDGKTEFVGNDRARAFRAITEASRASKATVHLERIDPRGQNEPQTSAVRVRVDNLAASAPRGPVDVWLAVAEDGLTSSVTRGENSGRRLPHIAVVRSLSAIGKIDPAKGETFSAEPVAKIRPEWKHENLKIVVFLQERRARRILGAASLPLIHKIPQS
jgi:hypothetical protein